VIRVLLASRSSEVENTIRSIAALEFAGRVNLSQGSTDFAGTDFAGDVLLVDSRDLADNDWRTLAELPIPAVLLLEAPDADLAAAALRAGIRGAILLDSTPDEIESAVRAVHSGLVVTAPELLADPNPLAELVEPLSAREIEVLDLLAEGMSNKLIAHRLTISEHTVKTHVASIFAKLGASSRTEAVSQAIRRGLVML
jgi:two-component system, NarL family, response regulator YdfI